MLKKFRVELFIVGVFFFNALIPYSFDTGLYKYFKNFDNSLLKIPLKEFFINITKLGDSLWYFLFSIFFILVFYIINKSESLTKYNKTFKKIYYLNIVLFLSVLYSGIITQILKHLVGRSRPNAASFDNEIFFNFFTFDSNFHSFPSGHTSTIFAVALACILAAPKLKYFFFFLALVVSFSRVVVEAHFLTDILGGIVTAFIGFKLSILSINIFFNFDIKKESLVIVNKNFNIILIATVILAIFLSIGPTFDVFFSGLFYQKSGLFYHEHSLFVLQSFYTISIFFRKIILPLILIYILILPITSLFMPLRQIYCGYNFKIKDILFLWASTILSLVILINLILKNFWGRARPNEIFDLGGSNYFTPWFQISKECATNCSFVSGDAAVGFALIVFFFLIKKNIFLWLALILGSTLGMVRILEGGHFLSDIILSCLIVFSFNYLVYPYYSKKTNG